MENAETIFYVCTREHKKYCWYSNCSKLYSDLVMKKTQNLTKWNVNDWNRLPEKFKESASLENSKNSWDRYNANMVLQWI